MIYTTAILSGTVKKNVCLSIMELGDQKRQMDVLDVMTLNIIRIFDRTGDSKTFHKSTSEYYRKYF